MAPLPLSQLAQAMVNAEWNSLLLSMDHWDIFAQQQGMSEPIQALVRDARSFAYHYKEFFEIVPVDHLRQNTTDEWTVLYQARELLLYEWDTVRHALEQRTNDRYLAVLKDLDLLAGESLQALFPIQAERTITYLHKLYDITRFAFSQMPLIGAPYSALHLPESWLSIPHEAGHYIFWNSTTTMGEFAQFYATLEQALISALAETLGRRQEQGHFRRTGEIYRIWLNWLNEIFADIYGTLVAGPAIGWSMQVLLRSRLNPRDLYHIHSDAEHPDPYIRPFIHIITLRQMAKLTVSQEFAEQLSIAADELEFSWRESWPGGDPATSLFTPDNWGSMNDLLQQDLPAIITALLKVNLGNLDGALDKYFVENRLYTLERHQRIMIAVNQLAQGIAVTDVASRLEVSAIAQLAIVNGADPAFVRSNFGFEVNPQPPEIDNERKAQFEDFLKNATGQEEEAAQSLAWPRVLVGVRSEVAEHYHSHVHQH